MEKFKFIISEDYRPCDKEVEKYLQVWKGLENYDIQEMALNKLFERVCPKNDNIQDIILKCSVLNNFYSTNIFGIYDVAKDIKGIKDLDALMSEGEASAVDKIANCGSRINYSFATKYCSHHYPKKYAIYDSYVAQALQYFRDRDKFADFKNDDLRNYSKFLKVILKFQEYYHIKEEFSLKEMDQYLWQFGKRFFSQYETKITDDITNYAEKNHIRIYGLPRDEKESVLRDIKEQIALANYKQRVNRGADLFMNIQASITSHHEANEKMFNDEYTRLEKIIQSVNTTSHAVPIEQDVVYYALALAEEADLIVCIEPVREYTNEMEYQQCDTCEYHPVLMSRKEFEETQKLHHFYAT